MGRSTHVKTACRGTRMGHTGRSENEELQCRHRLQRFDNYVLQPVLRLAVVERIREGTPQWEPRAVAILMTSPDPLWLPRHAARRAAGGVWGTRGAQRTRDSNAGIASNDSIIAFYNPFCGRLS